MRVKIREYHGLGNDYLVFDPERNGMELTPERVKLLLQPQFGSRGRWYSGRSCFKEERSI